MGKSGKDELLALYRHLPKHVRCLRCPARGPGLGHPCLRKARSCDEPFGVVLADDLIWNGNAGSGRAGALRQMNEVANREDAGVLAVEEVPREDTGKYGIVDAEPISERAARIRLVVEKPKPEVAPSNLAIVGRYVLPGQIFALLEKTRPGAGGEIQLTDAIEDLLTEKPVLAYRFEGTRFDCGHKLGLVKATVHMAMHDRQIGASSREFLAGLDLS